MTTPGYEAEVMNIPCGPAKLARLHVEDYKKNSDTSVYVRNTMAEVLRLHQEHAEASRMYGELYQWQQDKFIELQDREASIAEAKANTPARLREAVNAIDGKFTIR